MHAEALLPLSSLSQENSALNAILPVEPGLQVSPISRVLLQEAFKARYCDTCLLCSASLIVKKVLAFFMKFTSINQEDEMF